METMSAFGNTRLQPWTGCHDVIHRQLEPQRSGPATTVIADTDRPSGRWDLWTTSPWLVIITCCLTFAAFVCFGLRLLAVFRGEISSFMGKIQPLIGPTIPNNRASTPLPGFPATDEDFLSSHDSSLRRARHMADRSSDVASGHSSDGLLVNSLASANAEDVIRLQVGSTCTSSRDGDGLEYDDEFIVVTDANVSHIRPNSLNTSHDPLLCDTQHWV